MRYILLTVTLLLTAPAVQAGMKRQRVDKQMADIVAEVGLRRLRDDRKDYLGKELIRLARALDSRNAKADIGREVIDGKRDVPKDLEPAYEEGELADFMLKRADYLLKNKLPTDRAYSTLCLAYVSAASALKPGDKRSDKCMLALKKMGIGSGVRKPAPKQTGPIVPKGANPPVKHNLGLGYGPKQVLKLYGKVKAKSKKDGAETLYMSDDRGMHAAEFYNGVCRRLNLSIEKDKVHLYLGLYGKTNDDWKRDGVDRWRSKCGNFIAYYDDHGKLEAMFLDLYKAKQGETVATNTGGGTETIGVVPGTAVKYRIKDYGLGTDGLDFARRVDKLDNKRYIRRPSEYIMDVRLEKRKYEAYFYFGGCRRMKTQISSAKVDSGKEGQYDAAVNKILDIRGEEDDGWVKKSDTRWESKDGKMLATVLAGNLNIWDRAWYEKHRD